MRREGGGGGEERKVDGKSVVIFPPRRSPQTCGNYFLVRRTSKKKKKKKVTGMNGCTREECFSRMFLCRVETCERRRWILYLKEITIYVSFLCVCVLDKSIPVHCVFARV